MSKTTPLPLKGMRKQRGAGLLEALISIAVLSVGVLGIAQFQLGLLAQTTDSQARLTASALADELLTLMRVDAGNVNCYTLPQSGACTSPDAQALAVDWSERVAAQLPGFVSATSVREGDFQLLVTLRWTSKAFSETRQLEVRTDARP